MADNVKHPSHYADHCSVECIDMIRVVLGKKGFDAFCIGNAIKYLWRYKHKNGYEDLEKADTYIGWVSDESDERIEGLSRILGKALILAKARKDNNDESRSD